MNKLMRLSIVSAMLCGLAYGGQSYAAEGVHQDGKPHHCKHMNRDGAPGKLDRLSKHLDLSDAQKVTLKAQREANKTKGKAQHEKLKAARQALASATETGAADAKLQALAKDLGQLQGQEAYERAQNRKAFLAVLTPEQKVKMQEMKAQRSKKADAMNKP